MPYAFQCRRCHGPPLPDEWEGACPNCNGFYRAVRIRVKEGEVDGAQIQPLKEGEVISAYDALANLDGDESMTKRPTGLTGLDHVFSGGLPRSGAVLLCAEGGTGKTTWLWTLFSHMAEQEVRCLYISSEQSVKQLCNQLARCGTPPERNLSIVSENNRDAIVRIIEKEEPELVALDSLHEVERVTDEEGFSMASGGVTAVTRVAKEIRRLCEELDMLAFCVGHMNNDGSMAGGAHLRHALDACLVMRRWKDDKDDPRRVLEFEGKCRFGVVGNRALLRMGETGIKDCGPLYDDDDDGGGSPVVSIFANGKGRNKN